MCLVFEIIFYHMFSFLDNFIFKLNTFIFKWCGKLKVYQILKKKIFFNLVFNKLNLLKRFIKEKCLQFYITFKCLKNFLLFRVQKFKSYLTIQSLKKFSFYLIRYVSRFVYYTIIYLFTFRTWTKLYYYLFIDKEKKVFTDSLVDRIDFGIRWLFIVVYFSVVLYYVILIIVCWFLSVLDLI